MWRQHWFFNTTAGVGKGDGGLVAGDPEGCYSLLRLDKMTPCNVVNKKLKS